LSAVEVYSCSRSQGPTVEAPEKSTIATEASASKPDVPVGSRERRGRPRPELHRAASDQEVVVGEPDASCVARHVAVGCEEPEQLRHLGRDRAPPGSARHTRGDRKVLALGDLASGHRHLLTVEHRVVCRHLDGASTCLMLSISWSGRYSAGGLRLRRERRSSSLRPTPRRCWCACTSGRSGPCAPGARGRRGS